MSMIKRGFTIIEVTLFLAVTGLLFVGIMVGTQNSIWQHRYNDTVQNFADFWRNIYSDTLSPGNYTTDRGGMSDRAIYGKLVVFGTESDGDGAENKIDVYTVTGKADCAENEDGTGCATKTELIDKLVGVDLKASTDSREDYRPKWGAKIQDTEGATYRGLVLVVRHPEIGTVNTLVAPLSGEFNPDTLKDSLKDFGFREADFCVRPDGGSVLENMRSRDVRLVKNARNASGIELIDLDSEDNRCKRAE